MEDDELAAAAAAEAEAERALQSEMDDGVAAALAEEEAQIREREERRVRELAFRTRWLEEQKRAEEEKAAKWEELLERVRDREAEWRIKKVSADCSLLAKGGGG
jgi:hypothetical protein